jgi:hypothetical protein
MPAVAARESSLSDRITFGHINSIFLFRIKASTYPDPKAVSVEHFSTLTKVSQQLDVRKEHLTSPG